jgi:hypothetical protein
MHERRQFLSPETGGGSLGSGGTPIFQPGAGGGLRQGNGGGGGGNGGPPKVSNGGSSGGVSPARAAADHAEADPVEVKPKIRAFAQSMESGHHGREWIRGTNKDGTGATHVKSFHCKLAGDALVYLDEQINEWLDTHPDYEVKLVTTSVGEWTGKMKEPHMVVQVWV